MTPTKYTLLGITDASESCDCCGRTLARVFRVGNGETVRHLGRVCARKATGYDWSVAQAERIEAHTRKVEAARARYGDLYTEAETLAAATARRYETSGVAGEALGLMQDGGDVEVARRWLADARRSVA